MIDRSHAELGAVAPSVVDDLIAKYSPESDEYDVVLPGGEKLRFRVVRSYAELQSLGAAGVAFFNNACDPAKALPEWRDFIPNDVLDGVMAYLVSALSVEPKINQIQALKIMKSPFIAETVVRQMDMHRYRTVTAEALVNIDSAKKESGPMDTGDFDSKSA